MTNITGGQASLVGQRISEVKVIGAKDPTSGLANVGLARSTTPGVNSQSVVVFAPGITNQAVLNQMAQGILNTAVVNPTASKGTGSFASMQITVKDTHPSGSYHPEDQIVITSPTLGIAGAYYIKRIQRDLINPDYAIIDLVNRQTELWMLDEYVRQAAKDLAALATT
jgi:hypothetical protein